MWRFKYLLNTSRVLTKVWSNGHFIAFYYWPHTIYSCTFYFLRDVAVWLILFSPYVEDSMSFDIYMLTNTTLILFSIWFINKYCITITVIQAAICSGFYLKKNELFLLSSLSASFRSNLQNSCQLCISIGWLAETPRVRTSRYRTTNHFVNRTYLTAYFWPYKPIFQKWCHV